eukprot:COSAG01_NODE_38640_length_487_cov_0.626289_1_plen_134_part_10
MRDVVRVRHDDDGERAAAAAAAAAAADATTSDGASVPHQSSGWCSTMAADIGEGSSWYNLNDSTCLPVSPETLQATFGGSSCAYMLVYRSREACRWGNGAVVMPPHLLERTERRHAELERERREHTEIVHTLTL